METQTPPRGQYRGGAPKGKKHVRLLNDAAKAAIAAVYRRGRQPGDIKRLSQRLNMPAKSIQAYARRAGLARGEWLLNQPWTPEEIELLHETADIGATRIAAHWRERAYASGGRIIPRTESAIRSARAKHGIYWRNRTDNLSASQLAAALRTTPHTVTRWIERGDLKAHRDGREYQIAQSDFAKFVRKHPASIDPSRLTRAAFGWIVDLLSGK